MSPAVKRAKGEGEQAFLAGIAETANPYKFGTDEFLSWNDGYLEMAEAEGEDT